MEAERAAKDREEARQAMEEARKAVEYQKKAAEEMRREAQRLQDETRRIRSGDGGGQASHSGGGMDTDGTLGFGASAQVQPNVQPNIQSNNGINFNDMGVAQYNTGSPGDEASGADWMKFREDIMRKFQLHDERLERHSTRIGEIHDEVDELTRQMLWQLHRSEKQDATDASKKFTLHNFTTFEATSDPIKKANVLKIRQQTIAKLYEAAAVPQMYLDMARPSHHDGKELSRTTLVETNYSWVRNQLYDYMKDHCTDGMSEEWGTLTERDLPGILVEVKKEEAKGKGGKKRRPPPAAGEVQFRKAFPLKYQIQGIPSKAGLEPPHPRSRVAP